MKKYFITVVLVLSLSLLCLFTSCKSKNTDNYDNSKQTGTHNADTKDISHDDNINDSENDNKDKEVKQIIYTGFDDELKELNLTRILYDYDYETALNDWIKVWVDYAYEQFGIYDYYGEIVKYNQVYINENLSVYYDKAFIKFNCDDLVESKEKNSDGLYIDEIYLVQAKTKDNSIYYVDVIVDKNQSLDEVVKGSINIVASDERFSEFFLASDDTKKDDEMNDDDNESSEISATIFNKNNILEGYTLYDIGSSNNEIIMLFGKIDDASEDKHDLKLCMFDYKSMQITETKDLGIMNYKNSNYYDNYGFRVYSGKRISKTEEINYCIDVEGNITEVEENEPKYFYTSDQKYYAYSDEKGNLYIVDNENKETSYTLNSVLDNIVKASEYITYSVQKWIDDTRLLYNIGGYEWSNGYGIIDIATGENIVLEESKMKHKYRFVDNKFYVFYSWFDVTPYKLGYYDLNLKPYKYVEIFNDEQFSEIYDVDGVTLEFWRYLTSDEKQMFMWAYNGAKHEYVIKTYSIESAKIEKDMYFKIDVNSVINSIDNAFVIDDTILVIEDYNNIYIINLVE